jgi:hypothetical protein
MKIRECKPAYLNKAQDLSEQEAELVLSRMRNKLFQALKKDELSTLEILGIQLEIEEEQLREWREKMTVIQEKENKKSKDSKSKKSSKDK